MEFHLRRLPILAFLCVALAVACHATSSSEEYWKNLLPYTPMPKAIVESLQSDASAGVHVGDKGVDVSVGKPGKGGATDVHVGKGGATGVHVGKGGTSVEKGPKGKGVFVDVKPGHPHPFMYLYAATKTQLNDNPNVALFFQEKDLKPGMQMNLLFTKSTNGAPFLPRPVANSIPFSSDKLPEILGRLRVDPDSDNANIVKETIKECEEKSIEGEDKYCATSLESMLDYTTSKLGKNVKPISTNVEKETTKMEKYMFKQVWKMSNSEAVVCHKQNYAYAVFYCHKSEATKSYKVSLVGANGVKVMAAVVCHTDTSKWNPKHLAFQVLKLKPGTVPICHFLPEDHIVWVHI